MKKCPFCKAQIDESARFCLYCMTPLLDKEVTPPPHRKPRRWWPVLVCVAVILLVLLFLLWGKNVFGKNDTPSPSGNTQKTTAPPRNPTEESTLPTGTTQPETPDAPEAPTLPETPDEPDEPEPPVTVVYRYRTAHAGDEHSGITVDPENDIVITGVEAPAADGVYHIPSYIDGKRVIAIGYIAFNLLDVKEVVLGETIRNVHQNAFIGCYNIEKFYVKSNTLYISRSAFTDASRRNCTLTFYSSAHCADTISGGSLKDAVSKFGAVWEEWDG